MIIVDTSVWIEFFRRPGSSAGDGLSNLIRENRAALVGIVLAEILRGIRSDRQRRLTNEVLDAIPHLETTRRVFARAGLIAKELDMVGRRIPMNDALIGAVAIEDDHEVFTNDTRHFERIPGLRLYKPEGDVT